MAGVTPKCAPGMVYIPAGSYERGSTNSENEQPIRSIDISAFCADKHSVTNSQYSQYLSQKKLKAPLLSPTGFDRPHQPRVNVDWNEANNFCKGEGKRLPTEAEREKMAKGPSGKAEFGTSHGQLEGDQGQKLAHYNEDTTKEVCSYPTNGYGLCDMSGNIYEWTSDWYHKDYYQTSPTKNPQGPASGEYKVMRGGYWWWYVNTDHLRTTERSHKLPTARGYGIGFRCVSDVK